MNKIEKRIRKNAPRLRRAIKRVKASGEILNQEGLPFNQFRDVPDPFKNDFRSVPPPWGKA